MSSQLQSEPQSRRGDVGEAAHGCCGAEEAAAAPEPEGSGCCGGHEHADDKPQATGCCGGGSTRAT